MLCPYCGTAGDENRGITPPLVRWSRDGRFLYLHASHERKTFVLPLRTGEMVPRLPAGGFNGILEAASALGAREIPDFKAYVSDDPDVYVYLRLQTHRNIYRVSVK